MDRKSKGKESTNERYRRSDRNGEKSAALEDEERERMVVADRDEEGASVGNPRPEWPEACSRAWAGVVTVAK